MKQTTTTCDRCGSVVTEGESAIEAQYGPLVNRLNGQQHFCLDCQDRFLDWLRSGRQNGLTTGS
jgi:hypothetical protein